MTQLSWKSLDAGDPLLRMPAAKLDKIGFQGGPGSKDPGRIDYTKVTLKVLLARAYNVRPDQVSGPGWLDTERYTIAAELPPGTNAERLGMMLQKLLTERFRISLHRESKEIAVYRLTVARNGPKLQPVEELPKYENEAEERAAVQARLRASLAAMSRGGGGSILWFHLPTASMAKFAETLSSNLDRPVKDMTQTEGLHSFDLRWAPEGANLETSGHFLFAAIQEQLGLKLEAGKESTELLISTAPIRSPSATNLAWSLLRFLFLFFGVEGNA